MKLEINGKVVEVDDSFRSLSPEEQEATVNEIAQSMGLGDSPNAAERFLGQAARSIGGAVDAVVTGARNDVRRFRGQEVIPYGGEGSVVNLLADAGIASRDAPDGIIEQAGSAGGDAIVAFAPMLKALQASRGASGATGQIAEDMYQALVSRLGLPTEVLAGAGAGAAEEAARQAGAPEWAANLAAVGGGMAVPGVAGAAKGSVQLADKASEATLMTRGIKNMSKEAARTAYRTFVPMSEEGGRQQAARRLEELVGTERAKGLADQIDPADEFGRTGAEQTGDPNLMGLQREAAREDPIIRERLDARRAASEASIVDAVRAEGGDVLDARTFFRRRLSQFGKAIDERIDNAMQEGRNVIQGVRPGRTEDEMSEAVVEKLKTELGKFREEERRLWSEVPQDATVPTDDLKAVAARIEDQTSMFQTEDIPAAVSILKGNQVGDTIPASEVHGLYSKMREIARNARAAGDMNKARLADQLAEAADEALATIPGKSAAEARAFTRQLHEKFSTGAPAKLLARTSQGVERIPPETALRRTVAGGGPGAKSAAEGLETAAPGTAGDVRDFLSERFAKEAMDGAGNFTTTKARNWMRENQSILDKNPELRQEFESALESQSAFVRFAERAKARSKLAADSTISRFNAEEPGKAVTAIIAAENPVRAAKSIANAARKDPDGKALDGVRGAFTNYLTEDPYRRLPAIVEDAKLANAMSKVFTPGQMDRLKKISQAMISFEEPPANVPDVINTPANKILDMVVRIFAAKTATQLHPGGNAGVDLQTAQMASQRAKEWLNRLTNDRARQLLMDAVEDPELMRTLLLNAPGPKLPPKAAKRLAPYLIGTTAAGVAPEE